MGKVLAPDVICMLEELITETVRAEIEALTPSDNGRKWFTVPEAALRLGCSEDAVRMRVARGRLKPNRRQGRRLYIAASAIDDLR